MAVNALGKKRSGPPRTGAPVGFGGLVLPNPRGLKPQRDTDEPDGSNSIIRPIPSIVKKSIVTHKQEPMSTMPNPKAVDIGQNQQLRSFKKGTSRVPKTGVYKLHKNEAVIPAKKAIEMRKDRGAEALSGSAQVPKLKKKNSKHPVMHIAPVDDGSFHVTHDAPADQPMAQSRKFSARHAKALVKHVRNTYVGADQPNAADPDGVV